MKLYIYPYKMSSEAAKLLAQELNVKRIRQNGHYICRKNDLIFNYGNAHKPIWAKPNLNILNHWDNIAICCDKLETFKVLKEAGVNIPDFTTDIEEAKKWIPNHIVFCRKILDGRSGWGIVIARTKEEMVQSPLYVKYIKKKIEYRIAVFKGIVIDAIQKKKRINYNGEFNDLIRSFHKGWTFCRKDVNPPKCVLEQAINATKALQLDYCAVDIIYNNYYNKAFVLEGNCAAGISPNSTTLKRYTEALRAILNNQPPKQFEVVHFDD